jgi:Domain of Unknown Function (DUF1206)
LLESGPTIVSRTCTPSGDLANDALTVQRSRPFCWMVRAGFVTRGITYGVIGGIAAALALGIGSDGGTPNQQGALMFIAEAPLGRAVIVVATLGLLAYALWKLGQAVIGKGPEGGGGPTFKDRIANLGGSLVYWAFFAVAVRVLIGAARGNETAEQRHATAGVLHWPGGSIIVMGVGALLIGVSLFQIWEAVSDKFADDNKLGEMSRTGDRLFLIVGRIGLTARALVFVLIGYFLIKTAIEVRTSNGIGLDGTLAAVHGEPLGAVLLALVSAGLLIFAVFSFLEARYRRL